MNSTNRFLNRALVIVVGLVLVIVGGAAIAVVTLPAAADWVDSATAATVDGVKNALVWLGQEPTATSSVLLIALLVVAVIIVILAFGYIFGQGGGRIHRIISGPKTSWGTTVVESSVAEHAIKDALDQEPEFASSRVTAYRVRSTPTLAVTVSCRRGVSPSDAVARVTDTLRALDAVLGEEIPAYIQVQGGFRANSAAGASRVN
jgi:hypothetical protein